MDSSALEKDAVAYALALIFDMERPVPTNLRVLDLGSQAMEC